MIKKILLTIIIISGLAYQSFCFKTIGNEEPNNVPIEEAFVGKQLQSEFVTTAIFDITSDTNLTDYGLPGSGTIWDPYRIENYESTNIHIENTTKEIIIQNCTIKGSYPLFLKNIEPNTIIVKNNTIKNSVIGITLAYCSYLIIENNLFENNFESIHMYGSSYIDIIKNKFRNNDYGPRSYFGSPNSNLDISHNEFKGNNVGISFEYDVFDFTIYNNSFLNQGTAIGISSEYETNGIFSKISYNLIENSSRYGISLGFCTETLIHHNTFANNNLDDVGSSQANENRDDCIEIYWYDKDSKEGNYWSDWNGIISYKIDGPTETKDKYPLRKPTRATQTEIPSFFAGYVLINSTIIPAGIIILGVMVFVTIRRYKTKQ